MAAPVDPIAEVAFGSWREFKLDLFDRLLAAGELDRPDTRKRTKFLFRGQSCNDWHLLSSFDRLMEENGITGLRIEEIYDESLEEFYNNGVEMSLFSGLTRINGQESFPAVKAELEKISELEAFAQHYGFPTRLLDWSESPYVAAFFAACDYPLCTSGFMSIWCLNVNIARRVLTEHDLVIRERTLDSEKRQVWQRASFTINRTNLTRTNEIFLPSNAKLRDAPPSPALIRCTLPVAEAKYMLSDLDFMRINYLSVFPDIEGLVKYAKYKTMVRIARP